MVLARSAKAFLHPPLVSSGPKYSVSKRQLSKPNALLSFVKLFSGVDVDSPDDVLNVFQKPNAVILDVRSKEEIVRDGFIRTSAQTPWFQVSCTPKDCPLLDVAAENMIPDKSSKYYSFLETLFVIAFCEFSFLP